MPSSAPARASNRIGGSRTTQESGVGTVVANGLPGITQQSPGPQGAEHSIAAKTPRKPPHVAHESERTGSISGAKRGRPVSAQKLTEAFENTVLFWGITRDPEIQRKVRLQVRRMRANKKRRYDPRVVSRLISKRLHIPEIAVDEILQGSVPEFEEWKSEVISGIARVLASADARAEDTWKRRTA
jgi:hypothetical protein